MNRTMILAALAAASLALPSLLKADPLSQVVRDLSPVMVAPGVFVPAALAPRAVGVKLVMARPAPVYPVAQPYHAPVYHPWLTTGERWRLHHRLPVEREQAWRHDRGMDNGWERDRR
jgi:hypothetical protein